MKTQYIRFNVDFFQLKTQYIRLNVDFSAEFSKYPVFRWILSISGLMLIFNRKLSISGLMLTFQLSSQYMRFNVDFSAENSVYPDILWINLFFSGSLTINQAIPGIITNLLDFDQQISWTKTVKRSLLPNSYNFSTLWCKWYYIYLT